MTHPIANTPEPPYYAVIFTSLRAGKDDEYENMAESMVSLAMKQKGFLGFESARNELGISVSYWKDEQAISAWKENLEHRVAREKGRSTWYRSFKVRVAKVERDYDYPFDTTIK